MEDPQVLEIISNLKGRRNYEEKKSRKLGYKSQYEYFEHKLSDKVKIKEEKENKIKINF